MVTKTEGKNKKVRTFMCTMVPGFEQVAKEEIKAKFPGAEHIEMLRGKVFFTGNMEKESLFTLECVDNVYYYITEFRIGPHKKDLEQLYRDMKRVGFREVAEYLRISKVPRILVSASKKGKQTYSRFDVAEWATKAIVEGNRFLAGSVEQHDFPIRIDVNRESCMVSVQMTPADFKFRGNSYAFMPGGIRPTVAAALVRLSKPKPEDVFYDPFCGSGTIVRERARLKAKRIMGSDINPEAVDSAKKNVSDTVKVFCCDATCMKAADGSVDVIVSNIPWGKQIAVENIGELYTNFLKEASRVLTKDGRMILLTDREEIIDAAAETGVAIERLYTISLHGLVVGVYGLHRETERKEV